MYSIYRHTSPSGKVYIGLTKQEPEKRWQKGLGYRTQEYFYRAIVKYGWDNFKHEVLFCTDSYEEACQMEIEYIAEFKSNDKRFGYNVEAGGNAKKEVSEETREKLRKANTTPEKLEHMAEFNKKRWSDPEEHEKMRKRFLGENNPMYGKKLSEEHKRKLREGFERTVFVGKKGKEHPLYGTKLSEERKRQISERNFGANSARAISVRCIETQTVYGSIQDAKRATGIDGTAISRVCKGVSKTAGGFHWEFAVEV